MTGWRQWFFGILLIAALIGAVLHFGELRHFAELVRRVEPGWLLIAVALQLSTYASLALGRQVILKQAECRQFRLPSLIRIALSKLFADQAVPTAGMLICGCRWCRGY